MNYSCGWELGVFIPRLRIQVKERARAFVTPACWASCRSRVKLGLCAGGFGDNLVERGRFEPVSAPEQKMGIAVALIFPPIFGRQVLMVI
jgi:hypothetical protein